MNQKEYAKIIAKNLKRIAHENDKSQADISRDLKISKATISSWMNGTRIPRMGSIDRLCHYFNVRRSDIMEEQKGERPRRLRPDELRLLESYNQLPETSRKEILDFVEFKAMKEAEEKRESFAG